jgi:hypothetical protein
MQVNMAHLRERSTSGGWVDFAVFDARSQSGTNADNAALLQQLTHRAMAAGLKVDKAALAFQQNGRIQFYGATDLVNYLSRSGLPRWTHKLDS